MRKKLLSLTMLVLLGLITQSFQLNFNSENNSEMEYELEVRVDGFDVQKLIGSLYDQFDFCDEVMGEKVFERAMTGYLYLYQTGELKNDRYLSVIDFTLSSKKKRLWVLDLENKSVVINELVAHGKNSGLEYATSFSNRIESLQSSLGFYVTDATYNGKHRYSLKLRGMESGFNSNAFSRGVVIHGANYVSEEWVEQAQRIGRSFGCPAVSQSVNKDLVDTIKDGTCLFIHYPDKHYLSRSKILNNNVYVPYELVRQLQE